MPLATPVRGPPTPHHFYRFKLWSSFNSPGTYSFLSDRHVAQHAGFMLAPAAGHVHYKYEVQSMQPWHLLKVFHATRLRRRMNILVWLFGDRGEVRGMAHHAVAVVIRRPEGVLCYRPSWREDHEVRSSHACAPKANCHFGSGSVRKTSGARLKN